MQVQAMHGTKEATGNSGKWQQQKVPNSNDDNNKKENNTTTTNQNNTTSNHNNWWRILHRCKCLINTIPSTYDETESWYLLENSWGMKPQMWCTKKYFFNNLFYSKLFWNGKGNLTLSLFILMSNYRCIFIVHVVQWIGLVYFLCYVHSSIKVILGDKRWCIILWIPFFIGPDFKIRSLPFIREHWRHETEKVCAFHVKMEFLRLPNCLWF